MNPPRIFTCLIVVLVFSCFTSCNNASEESVSTTTTSDLDETGDSYSNESVGANNTAAKQQLAKKINNLLVFHADDTMQLNHAYTATLALAKSAVLAELKEKVLEASDATDTNTIVETNIEMGKKMRARLVDMSPRSAPSFIIEAMGEEIQSLNSSKEAYWNWKIEPLKEGDHKLKLSIQVIQGEDDKVNLPPRDITVTIFAQKVSLLTKARNFFSDYWQWIITGILLPVFIAWLTTRLKQANEAKKT